MIFTSLFFHTLIQKILWAVFFYIVNPGDLIDPEVSGPSAGRKYVATAAQIFSISPFRPERQEGDEEEEEKEEEEDEDEVEAAASTRRVDRQWRDSAQQKSEGELRDAAAGRLGQNSISSRGNNLKSKIENGKITRNVYRFLSNHSCRGPTHFCQLISPPFIVSLYGRDKIDRSRMRFRVAITFLGSYLTRGMCNSQESGEKGNRSGEMQMEK